MYGPHGGLPFHLLTHTNVAHTFKSNNHSYYCYGWATSSNPRNSFDEDLIVIHVGVSQYQHTSSSRQSSSGVGEMRMQLCHCDQ